jgi:hypothetical protein
MSLRTSKISLWAFGLLLILMSASVAGATALSVARDIQGHGLAVADGGVGLQGIGSGTRNLTVDIGGPVQGALLYWTGRDRPCPMSGGGCVVPFQPYKDQILRVDGVLVTGTIIGTEGQPVSGGGPINNIGFLADITSLVQAKGTGLQTFAIKDGDTASNLFRLNGVGLLVIYTDPADTTMSRLIVYDGLDFAFGADPTPGETRVMAPVTFNHDAQASARQARLRIFSGDSVAGRPDRIDISNNPSVFDSLDSSDGASFDTDVLVVDVPAGVASTTVQLFSAPPNQNPDSLLWILGVLRLPLEDDPEEPAGCTPGYWKNHEDSWAGTGYAPGQTVGSVFSGASAFPSQAASSLLQALQGGGGSGLEGGARILIRAAVAALLNAAHPDVDYPRTTAQILADVSSALTSGNRNTMLNLAAALDNDNNIGCPLN